MLTATGFAAGLTFATTFFAGAFALGAGFDLTGAAFFAAGFDFGFAAGLDLTAPDFFAGAAFFLGAGLLALPEVFLFAFLAM
ncbi:MAG TPA: hypothetical protein VK826_10830 [Bacteroidia bacterium]|nr:hypothetical protein [Bacteroidia bacterium]